MTKRSIFSFMVAATAFALLVVLSGCQRAAPTAPAPTSTLPHAVTTKAAAPPSPAPEESTPASAPGGSLQITFTADRTQINPGECATLQWQVGGGFAVFLEDEQVKPQGNKRVCPEEGRAYTLRVDMGDRMEERTVQIQVGGQPAEAPPSGEEPTEEPNGTPDEGTPGDQNQTEPVNLDFLPPASALNATPPLWNAAHAQPVTVSVDGAQVGAPISPYVYSAFIEHQGRSIYDGIWAEMLLDRKFYYPVNYYFPWGTLRNKSPWYADAPDTLVVMDTEHAFVGKHSPLIVVDGLQPRGIVQDGLGLKDGKGYTGYVYLAADGQVQAKAVLVWGPEPTQRQEVALGVVGQGFQKFPFTFTAGADTDRGRLEILGTGQGRLYVGSPSLMPADNIQGMRADVIVLLKQLGFTLYRWPGGTFANGYDWRQAVGDRDKRPPRLNKAYWSVDVESNDFGTDEFMAFCQLVGAEAYIALSDEKPDDPQRAAQWVEYLNGGTDTPMGQLRAANGHPEPYGVHFFGIGNEMWYVPLAQYIPMQNKVAQAVWQVDPNATLIAVGGLGFPGKDENHDWSYGMLEDAGDNMTLLAEHLYAEFREDTAEHSEALALMTRSVAQAHRQYRQQISGLDEKDIRLALDEWNYLWSGRPELYGEAAPPYYFRDALGIARGLHAVFANSDLIAMVNFHAVNVHGQVKTTKTDAALEATGLAWSLYRHHFGTLPVSVSGETEGLDVAAAWNADKTALTIAVVNPTQTSYRLTPQLQNARWNGSGQAWYLSAAPWAFNAPGRAPQVSIQTLTVDDPAQGLPVYPLSVMVYVVPAAPQK